MRMPRVKASYMGAIASWFCFALGNLRDRQRAVDVGRDVDVGLETHGQAQHVVGDAGSARTCGPSRRCVVVAGCVTRLLASPKLLEILTSFRALRKRNAASLPPAISKTTTCPKPDIWRLASAACG